MDFSPFWLRVKVQTREVFDVDFTASDAIVASRWKYFACVTAKLFVCGSSRKAKSFSFFHKVCPPEVAV